MKKASLIMLVVSLLCCYSGPAVSSDCSYVSFESGCILG